MALPASLSTCTVVGTYVDVQVRSRLANLRAELINYRGEKNEGTYMFTLDWSHFSNL